MIQSFQVYQFLGLLEAVLVNIFETKVAENYNVLFCYTSNYMLILFGDNNSLCSSGEITYFALWYVQYISTVIAYA
jgi:hypothetical protein